MQDRKLEKELKKMRIEEIDTKKIILDIEQPRKEFKNVGSLCNSILKEGLIQPLEVLKQKDGTFLLIDGERRLKAIQHLKWEKVPCIIKTKIKNKLLRQMVTNFHKEMLNPIEEGESIKKLIESGFIKKEICSLLGIGNSKLNRCLRFLKFNENTKKKIISGELSETAFRKLLTYSKIANEDRVVKRIIEEEPKTEAEIKKIINEEQNCRYILNSFLSEVYKFGKKSEIFKNKLVFIKENWSIPQKLEFEKLSKFTSDKIVSILDEINSIKRIEEQLTKKQQYLKDEIEKNL